MCEGQSEGHCNSKYTDAKNIEQATKSINALCLSPLRHHCWFVGNFYLLQRCIQPFPSNEHRQLVRLWNLKVYAGQVELRWPNNWCKAD